MSLTKEEIVTKQTKEHFGKEASSQSAPISQEPLPVIPTVPKKELVAVTAKVRTISQQNTAMRELLEHIQSQLTNSSQNEEVIPLEREVDVDMIADYTTDKMIGKVTVPSEYSRANASRRWASVFDILWKISINNFNREPQLSLPIDTCISHLGIGAKDELHYLGCGLT
ncbi:Hypothetical predicted protein [Olea europaea subsp. europaea]|uniref:Uncharacterized protein n=1 Tax=Olea europaea subsp. europaea TaxID=158383 RepID=A0A8S0RTI0_OLEEU|nr:Hypothetical predicted protein [Olea europaea subsp. europaea]